MSSALRAVVESLRFSGAEPGKLRELRDADWRKLLALTDRSHLTLLLGARCRGFLPEWVRQRVDRDLSNNAIRQARIAETYQRAARALVSARTEFLVLKGFSHYPLYCADLNLRPQYDLDLYCPPEQIERAYRALMALGYQPFGHSGQTALDHLPPLILQTGWRPRGDYYDPDIPITIEIHFRFWDRATERFDVSPAQDFWNRRQWREQPRASGPLEFFALHPADAFSYATWHLVRHLLRGDTRAHQVYEIAQFLHTTAGDDSFWRDWRDLRPSPLVEAIACRLAFEWFSCRMHPVMQELVEALPSNVQRWFDLFCFSPLDALDRPNKDELFLHLSLLPKRKDRWSVTRRRLFPKRLNPYIADAHVASPDLRLRVKRRAAAAAFLATRTLHHLRALLPVIRNGLRWRRALAGPRPLPAGRTPGVETAPQ